MPPDLQWGEYKSSVLILGGLNRRLRGKTDTTLITSLSEQGVLTGNDSPEWHLTNVTNLSDILGYC